jgi:iron(III)-enterobactin esterase
MFRVPSSAFLICLLTGFDPAIAKPRAQQAPAQVSTGRGARPPVPTRDPNTPGYVKAKELADGAIPSPKEDGNFILGPTHNPAPEVSVKEGVPQGQVFEFTMESKDSKIYPGIAREPNTFARPDPADPTS